MKMSETSYGIGGVWRCCIKALDETAPDKEVTAGDTVTCCFCGEVWTLGEDGLWTTAIQRGER